MPEEQSTRFVEWTATIKGYNGTFDCQVESSRVAHLAEDLAERAIRENLATPSSHDAWRGQLDADRAAKGLSRGRPKSPRMGKAGISKPPIVEQVRGHHNG